MAKKDNNYYFDAFVRSMAYARDAAKLLQRVMEAYDAETVHQRLEEMHTIEHSGDQVKHELTARLVKEFLPPIDREDIVSLAHSIDDVTDAVEDVLRDFYMYDTKALRGDVAPFIDVILRSCDTLTEAIRELPNFRKSTVLPQKIIEVNALEEEGDRLYIQAVHALYSGETDPLLVFRWTKLYERLERCCDCCENVADRISQVILKNS